MSERRLWREHLEEKRRRLQALRAGISSPHFGDSVSDSQLFQNIGGIFIGEQGSRDPALSTGVRAEHNDPALSEETQLSMIDDALPMVDSQQERRRLLDLKRKLVVRLVTRKHSVAILRILSGEHQTIAQMLTQFTELTSNG